MTCRLPASISSLFVVSSLYLFFSLFVFSSLFAVACSPPPSPVKPTAVSSTFFPSRTPPCNEPELWLGHHAIADVEDAYCTACSCSRSEESNEPTMGWDFLSPTRNPLDYGCRDLEYASLAIRAYHGKEVTREPFASVFKTKPWYKPQQRFREDSLSSAGQDALRWFDTVTDVCKRQPRERYAAPFSERIESWFASRRIGDIELPATLFVDFKPAAREQFLDFLGHDAGAGSSVFTLTPRTPIAHVSTSAMFQEAFPGVFVWVIGVGTSASTLSCIDGPQGTDCEGYESIQFVFDNETKDLIGLHVTASG